MRIKFLYFIILLLLPYTLWSQAAASSNYATQTGTLGATYSWIDCSAGTSIVTGDDAQGSFSWPFTFSFYDNTYTTTNSISVATNGFIRLDGTASTDYGTAQNYTLSSTSTELGQIIATSVYDCNVAGTGWVKYLVTGTAPNRILTIEYNNINIPYSSSNGANVQVSFYETLNKVVLKSGTDNITQAGADMGIHSGVSGYYNKWQEVASGTNNAWIEYTRTTPPLPPSGPQASWNYDLQTGVLGTTYSWISCSSGANVVTGDDAQATINWPFDFNFYDNSYTTSNSLSVCSNGFIRLDGDASTNYSAASAYTLSGTSTELGQIIALAVYDDKVGDNSGWVKSLVSGTSPNRIFTIEYNNLEINYNDGRYADVEVSFYESSNNIVIKFGADNVIQAGADMGIHSGISGYFNKWQEVASGTNSTWIEYTPPYIEVDATIGTSIAYYPTLKAAFDQVNSGTHRGNITIKIKHSTTETASAVLNASGTGSSNYSSVNIYPTETGLSISGNLATPLIELNGADYVIIDGRVNATGSTKNLIINNTSVSATSGTSTIRFLNDATTNTVKNCTIKGSGASAEGVILFSTTTGSSGNDANTIDNNNITNSTDANRPVNAIYSLGTSGKDNSGNTISNNNIYDFLRPASNSNGIYLLANNNTWTLDGNSFYETTSFASTGTFTYSAIQINNTSGNGFNVLNNYIGGTAAQCGGTAFTKTNARSNPFNAISLNVGTTTSSSVQNNTIQNFNWSNITNDTWAAINIAAGAVNIGTTTGNTIGAATGTGSISVTGTTNGQNVYGINIAGSGTVNCANNIIGSFVVANANSAYASNFTGINTTSTGTNIISNNTIGNISQANSINVSSASTANAQSVYGIRNTAAGNITIDNNTIANLNNGTTNTNTATLGLISGIASGSGINSITNNKISSLSIANANTASSNAASVTGIAVNSINTLNTISGNTIYSLSNSYNSFAGSVIALYFGSSGTSHTVTANFIYGLTITGTSATSASIYGIKINTGQTTYANNIISLGGNTANTIYGIYESGTATNNNSIFFNTVYIFGSLGSGITNKSYALFSNASTNVRDFRNNIFMNARSTTAGTNLHYAAYFNYSVSTNLTLNYNDYFVSGTGGVIGYAGANKTALPIFTGHDANSLNTNPVFVNGGGTNFLDYITATSLPGVFGTGMLTDYEGITRNNPPKMGALESGLTFTWQGNTSTNFATASNWVNGAVPPNGVDISFAATPTNDCYLDQNRTLKNITNTSAKKLVLNAKQLTITENIVTATANQIDATTASSVVIFAGTAAQIIPSGVFVSNTIDGITLNNSLGLTQNGAIIVPTSLTLTSGTFAIGANTLTLNGSVTSFSGSLTGGSSTNISIGGNGASTTLPAVSLNNLTLNRANGITTGGNITVAGTLTLTSGTLVLGANTLTISGNTPVRTSGNINAANTGSTLVFTNSVAITLPASVFTVNLNNLTVNGAGITASDDLTVNGILNLQSANASAVMGSLDMSSYTLNMGASGTTTGIGDVTGIVKRAQTFIPSVEYSFGNQFTSLSFIGLAGATKPAWISCKIVIGSVPVWSADSWISSGLGAIQRYYTFAIDDITATDLVNIKLHYLDTELNSNDETKIVFFDAHDGYPWTGTREEHGKSNNDPINNWVELADRRIKYLAPSTSLDNKQWALHNSEAVKNTWLGVADDHTEWNDGLNWTSGSVPVSTDDVLIPAGKLYYPSLTLNVEVKSLEIETNASVDANSYTITIDGDNGAWQNNGSFNAGTGKVIFNRNNVTKIVTIAGTTNFYDIQVGPNTLLQPVSGSIVRIAGAETSDITSLVDFSTVNNTVEWNGADQTIVNPTGIGGHSGYNILILSGSGTKTMPATAMNITDEFILSGTVTATAASVLNIDNELEIQNGATFATGNFDHIVGGHFDNSGTFIPSAGTTITLNGTAVQNIYGTTSTSFEKLTINNAAGVDIFTNTTVNNTLTLSSGNLNVGSTLLTLNGGITKTSGFLNVGASSSLYFGGTTALTTPSDLFTSTPVINNLTINRSGGVVFGSDITVNGILSLLSANPTAFLGSLDLGTFTLLMGASATTTGTGDVTGRVKRTTILPNIEYTFGHQSSSVTFPDIGTLPTEITLKISIGTAPTWKADGLKRIYDISQVGGSGTKGLLKSHYLDSELNGNTEINISFFSYIIPSSTLLDRGVTEINTTDNWITLNNTNFGNLPSAFGVIEHGFGVSTTNVITWDGSESIDWADQYNWTPAYSPDATRKAVIPDTATTPNDPIIANSSSTNVNTLTIQPGGILNAGTGSQLTIAGSSGAWNNDGTFNASTGKVIFNNGVVNEIVTIAGITNFYNIEVGTNTTIQPVAGSTLRIAGAGTADATSVIDFSTIDNTVEWNGADQTIVVPNGISGNGGYYNLILSGSGTKTMPAGDMLVKGNFSTSGTINSTAVSSFTVVGNITIGSGTAVTTGVFNHYVGGNFENNGTFNASAGGNMIFNGSAAQTISGSSTTSFDNLTIQNLMGVTLESNINVNNVLTFNNGNLSVGANTLGINGTVSNPSGKIDVISTSSLSFGGTSAITVNNYLFIGNPTINNLTINRSGGVTLGNESITVHGTLTLTSGTLAIVANTLTLTGNSPVRTSGNIDASHASAYLAFENAAAIALPASFFIGNVNNMTINGAGGITAGGDFTLDGILNLQSANPSSSKGSLDMSSFTLIMGASSTTIGQGDVSGIIKRTSIATNTTYTMGNQHTTIYFPNVGTLPTQMSLKVTLGSAPSWRAGAVERVYDFIQSGGIGTEAVLQSHYLDSELNGNDENKLVEWMHIYAYPLTIEYGRSNYNTNENWVAVSHVNVGVFASVFGAIEMIVDEYQLTNLTWNGSTSTSWITATNWTPQGAPSDETVVTIPDAATTTYDPSIPETALCGKVIIESGGILNSVSDGQLTVKGAKGAWKNSGTFAPGTGTVIFANGGETDTVTISGTSNFYNLTVTDKTRFQPDTNSVINIERVFTANTSNCILDFSSNPNTVGYNGSKAQNVIDPGAGYAYYNLALSGSGIKTLSAASFQILANFALSENASTTVINNLAVGVNLNISNTAVLTIEAGKTLTVSGSTSNTAGNAGLVLESNATGTASLMHNTADVPATVQRYISGFPEDWHLISSPVADQDIGGTWLPPGTYGNGTGYDMYAWNEPTSCWIYKLNYTATVNWNTVHPQSYFVAGRGYLYATQESNPTKEFIGNLNSGSITAAVAYEGTDISLKGFNLVGNPYPSSIDWQAASGWTRTDLLISGGGYDMWVWNPTANNYGVFNSATGIGTNSVTRYVAPMQGFFVQASSNGNMSMDNAVRTHDVASVWYKSKEQEGGQVSLSVNSKEGYGSDEVQLLYGYPENKNGARKMFSSSPKAPSLYMTVEKVNYSVLYFTNTEENPSVPVKFAAGADGNYSINCTCNTDDFGIVMLEDRQTHIIQDMKEKQTYTFNALESDDGNRFVLHFKNPEEKTGNQLPARIYSVGSTMYVDLSLVTEPTMVLISDLLGRKLFQQKLQGKTKHAIRLNTENQILVICLHNPEGNLSKKLFWLNQ